MGDEGDPREPTVHNDAIDHSMILPLGEWWTRDASLYLAFAAPLRTRNIRTVSYSGAQVTAEPIRSRHLSPYSILAAVWL